MIAQYLWLLGSLLMLILGSIHLYYTFFTHKFFPTQKALLGEMKEGTIFLTKETTIWKAWIGFNASHSMGAIYIGIINIFLAFPSEAFLQTHYFFYFFTILTIGFYLWLARKYWFKKPFLGILLALSCYVLSAIISLNSFI